MNGAKKKKSKKRDGTYVTVRIKRDTYTKLSDHKSRKGTPISVFIDMAVTDKLKEF